MMSGIPNLYGSCKNYVDRCFPRGYALTLKPFLFVRKMSLDTVSVVHIPDTVRGRCLTFVAHEHGRHESVVGEVQVR